MLQKVPIKEKGLVRVTFELLSTVWAERVNLVGEFNDWDTLSTPMTRERADANWKVIVELETGRRYRFRYLVDAKNGSTTGTPTISSRICMDRTTRSWT